MKYYVVTYTHTKMVGWTTYLHAHVKYLKDLVKKGKLQISGPGVGTPVRSAQLVFTVTDPDELDELIADDPYSIHDLVASKTVNLWNVQWGNMGKPDTPDPKETKYFRATYTLKDKNVPEDCEERRNVYLNGLLQEKKIRAAGPYENDASSGLSIISVADKDTAEAIMKEDPYVKELGADYQIIEWDPKFGEFR